MSALPTSVPYISNSKMSSPSASISTNNSLPSRNPPTTSSNIVKTDSDYILSNVHSTCDLADQVSGKVRELDLAQSRVNDTLLRIYAILERSNCIDRVQKALDSEDFESAANYVQTFLQIDAKYKDSAWTDQREQLFACKKKLEAIVRRSLSAAVDQRDHPTVLRFTRLYSPLCLEEEGLHVYEFQHLVELLSRIRLRVCGEDGIVYAICELQEEYDSRGSSIMEKYMEFRKLSKLTSEINSYKSDLLSIGVEGPDPREIELYLEEILSLTQLGKDYSEYMVSKIKGLSSVYSELTHQATRAFRNGNFSKVVQDITSYYVILEGFFMVEYVRKAIKIDEHVMDSLTMSMVDYVCYVLQSCCHRSISTSNVNSFIAVLSSAVSLLGSEYNDALQQKLREPNLGGKLFLGGLGVQKTGIEIATALNNMDVSSEYALKLRLRHEIEDQCAEVFPVPADRERTKSCLSELDEMSDNFKKALAVGLEQLVATVTLRIRPVLDSVATVSYELSEVEYAENEVNDPWVQRLLHAFETNVAWLQPLMTANNYDSFVHLVIDFIL